jgi:hypothetical protein
MNRNKENMQGLPAFESSTEHLHFKRTIAKGKAVLDDPDFLQIKERTQCELKEKEYL